MARRALPALLALVALCADLAGAHALASVALLGAIPAAFVLVLDCYGDRLAARSGGWRPAASALGLGLLVLSAALRSPAVVGGVPRLAVSAVVMCLLVYVGQAIAAVLRNGELVRVTAPDASGEEQERLAA